MKKTITALSTMLFIGSTFAANINCTGIDDNNNAFQVKMLNISNAGDFARGQLIVNSNNRDNVICGAASIEGVRGRQSLGSNLNFDLYAECDPFNYSYQANIKNHVGVHFSKAGRQNYIAEICSSEGRFMNIAGINFVERDCIEMTCSSRGLSTVR